MSDLLARPAGRLGNLVGGSNIVFFDHFLDGYGTDATPALAGKYSTTADLGDWLITQDAFTSHGNNPKPADDADGGWMQIAPDDDAGDHVSIQKNGEAWKVEKGRKLYYETRLKMSVVTSAFLCGLSVNTTDPHASAPSDAILFRTTGTAADVDIDSLVRVGSAGSAVDTTSDLTADTFVILAFEYDGNETISFFVNGVFKVKATGTAVPYGTFLSPVFCVERVLAADATTHTLTVDYVYVSNMAIA